MVKRKLSNNNLDDKTDYSYLCNGNNNCREIINNYLVFM